VSIDGKVAPWSASSSIDHGECDQADTLSTICGRDKAHLGLLSAANLHLLCKGSDRPLDLAAIQPCSSPIFGFFAITERHRFGQAP